ncbi:MAG: FAD-binding protein [Halobacteriales archaeon]
MADLDDTEVLIVGGGVAGRTAAIFTARHGLDTLVLDTGESLLRRNAHLENFPGFPAGVNARLLLELMADQLDRAGAARRTAEVVELSTTDGGIVATTADGETVAAAHAIAATKNAVGYLDGLADITVVDRGKPFVETDVRGRTGVAGLYVAGRLAGKPHQTVVAAGHGAAVAVTLLEDAEEPFYHDWVAPAGYFTGRGRDVPPGCEEIDEAEFRRRERESRQVVRDAFAEPHPEPPEQHPSVRRG